MQGDEGDAAMAQLTPAIRRAIGHEPAAYRLAVFGILHGSDSQMVGALVRCARAQGLGACTSSKACVWTGRVMPGVVSSVRTVSASGRAVVPDGRHVRQIVFHMHAVIGSMLCTARSPQCQALCMWQRAAS